MERAGARIRYCHQLLMLIENYVHYSETPREHVAARSITEYTAVLKSDITGRKTFA
jgi:hypothetical protein